MKYLCLVYIDSDRLEANPASECLTYANGLRERGLRLEAEALQCEPSGVRDVRVRDGEVTVTDGPFVETKEMLAGYYLLDVADFDEAVRIVRNIPCAPAGRIEIRPVFETAS